MGLLITEHDIEFSSMYFEIEGYAGEIDEDAIVDIEVPCACGTTATLCMSAECLSEIVNEAKLFRDRRITFKARGSE